jgi:hypothetical protein
MEEERRRQPDERGRGAVFIVVVVVVREGGDVVASTSKFQCQVMTNMLRDSATRKTMTRTTNKHKILS